MSAVSAPGACLWRSFTSVSISPKAATRCCRDGRGIDTKQCGLTMMHRVGPCRCEKTTYALPGPYGGGEVMVFAPYAKTSCPKVAVRPTQCAGGLGGGQGGAPRRPCVLVSPKKGPAGASRQTRVSAVRAAAKGVGATSDVDLSGPRPGRSVGDDGRASGPRFGPGTGAHLFTEANRQPFCGSGACESTGGGSRELRVYNG